MHQLPNSTTLFLLFLLLPLRLLKNASLLLVTVPTYISVPLFTSRISLHLMVACGSMLTLAPTFTSPTFLMNTPIGFTQLTIVVLLAAPLRTSLAKACGSYKATPEIVLIFESFSSHSVVLVPNVTSLVGTGTVFFIRKSQVPQAGIVTYANFVCNIRP